MLSRKALVVVAVAAALALFGASLARADDYYSPRYAKAPTYYAPPPFQWSGIYVGAHGGLAFTEAPNPFAGRNGPALGLQAGYLLQMGMLVGGGEIEASYLGNNEHQVPGGKLEETWRGALKGRAGVAFDRTLLYGTAGIALTRYNGADGLQNGSSLNIGYLLGGGIEQAFGSNLTARVEYNYIGTPDVSVTSIWGTQHRDIDSHVLKGGVNYRF